MDDFDFINTAFYQMAPLVARRSFASEKAAKFKTHRGFLVKSQRDINGAKNYVKM